MDRATAAPASGDSRFVGHSSGLATIHTAWTTIAIVVSSRRTMPVALVGISAPSSPRPALSGAGEAAGARTAPATGPSVSTREL